MALTHHIFLVPGFFGFANFGKLAYFAHVRRALEAELGGLGLDAIVHDVPTRPTASLRERARLLATQLGTFAGDADPIHIIGHSTGGLDARLLVAGGTDLGDDLPLPALLRRIRTVVAVATPHRGTPLAAFFAQVQGQHLLMLLSLAAIHVIRVGPIPLGVLKLLLSVLQAAGADDPLPDGLVQQVWDDLLSDFDAERRAALTSFFADVAQDQSLLHQLRPEAMDALATTLAAPAGLRCGSVVVRARRAGLASVAELGLDAAAQLQHAMFRLLAARTRLPDQVRSHIAPAQAERLADAFGDLPGPGATDGIVPTISEVWGDVISAVWGDHLDVIGHFHGPSAEPPHADWMVSGSRFDRERFLGVWREVARYVADAGTGVPIGRHEDTSSETVA